MVREAYHKDLHRLKEEILNMGNLVGKCNRGFSTFS